MAVKTSKWDVGDYLESADAVAGYLEAAFEDGDPQLIAAALGDVAKIRGMTDLAVQTDLSRESLYKSLSPNGNPEFGTIVKVLTAFGLQLGARRIGPSTEPEAAA